MRVELYEPTTHTKRQAKLYLRSTVECFVTARPGSHCMCISKPSSTCDKLHLSYSSITHTLHSAVLLSANQHCSV